MGRGPDVTSNPEHDDSVVRMFTCVFKIVGKAEKVVRKIASQEHCKGGCGNSTNLQEVFRFMSCRLYLQMIIWKRRHVQSDGSIS